VSGAISFGLAGDRPGFGCARRWSLAALAARIRTDPAFVTGQRRNRSGRPAPRAAQPAKHRKSLGGGPFTIAPASRS